MSRHAPHAVTLHFRGLRSIGVSPYWLGDPGGDLCNSNELLAVRYSCRPTCYSAETKQLLSCGCAHYRVQPNVARRPHCSCRSEEQTKADQSATLMEFLSLRRISSSESTPRRFATPTTFRPQGFAPSRRFTPRSNARPYFMPVTPMGFCSPGIYPHCQVPPTRRRGITLMAFLLRNAQ